MTWSTSRTKISSSAIGVQQIRQTLVGRAHIRLDLRDDPQQPMTCHATFHTPFDHIIYVFGGQISFNT
jgi:hypothetical protein